MMNKQSQTGQSKKRNRGILSCTECHRRKQRCDRARPCRDCQDRGVPEKCQYLKPKSNQDSMPNPETAGKTAISRFRRIMNSEVILTAESVAALVSSVYLSALEPASESVTVLHNADAKSVESGSPMPRYGQFMTRSQVYAITTLPRQPTISSGLNYNNGLDTYDPFSILPDLEGEPVPKQLLIRYYVERLAPWLCYLDDMLNLEAPRIAWLGFAVEHTAFYYATLLTAAVHLNRRRNFRDPAALIWYKVHTIQLANEKMNLVEEAASDEMIMTALILLYFNVSPLLDMH
ncbi:hypothetical protein B0J14DRAFT_585639 [Halenospora varia]|nr:hypothetical protein B0J14DRAFT_585639 [Halenospora varia]